VPDRACVCRYGGEEFCLLLIGFDIDKAASLAERLRRTMASPGFASVPVTLSFGVSSLNFGAASVPLIINQADEALYYSKNSGRNRVTRFSAMNETSPPRASSDKRR
jgi:diguanylate cyclase (GGDEF)-like protein